MIPALHRSTSEKLGHARATTRGTRDYCHIEHASSGALATDNTQVDALLRRHTATGQRYLFAINTYPEATRATFVIDDLAPGAEVEVLFE